MKRFYTTAELAAMLGCSKETVKSAVDRGDIKATKTPGGHARISDGEARRVVEKNGGVWDTRGTDDMAKEFEERAKVVVSEAIDSFSAYIMSEEDGCEKKEQFIVDEAVRKLKESAVTIFGG